MKITRRGNFVSSMARLTWWSQPLMKPRVDGPQIAIVTGPPGEVIFCDKAGVVCVCTGTVITGAMRTAPAEELNNRTTDVTANHRETIGGNHLITVKQNQIQTVVQNQQETVGQNQSITVGQNQAETVGMARLVLTQNGKIFLNGTAINLQGMQTLSGDALMINWNCGATEDPPKAPAESGSQPPDMRQY
nr:hypothetical protein [Salmonella enterica]